MTNNNQVLVTFETHIIEDWIDYNGHLNDANYLVIFTKASDGLQSYLGMTEATIQDTGYTLFTVESHLLYKQEIGLGAKVYITTQILEHDSKRMRIFHRMFNQQNELLATVEMLFISYHLQQQRVLDFAPEFAQNLANLAAKQVHLQMPSDAGKGIALKPKC